MKTRDEIIDVRLRLKAEISALVAKDVDRLMGGKKPLNAHKIARLRYEYDLTEAATNRLIIQAQGDSPID